MKHLCLVINRQTRQVYAEYEIEAKDWYFARNIAANIFQQEKHDIPSVDWCVDSMEI
jgi:hypothetical protein